MKAKKSTSERILDTVSYSWIGVVILTVLAGMGYVVYDTYRQNGWMGIAALGAMGFFLVMTVLTIVHLDGKV